MEGCQEYHCGGENRHDGLGRKLGEKGVQKCQCKKYQEVSGENKVHDARRKCSKPREYDVCWNSLSGFCVKGGSLGSSVDGARNGAAFMCCNSGKLKDV